MSIIVAVRHFSNRVFEFFVEIFMKDQRVRVICCALLFFVQIVARPCAGDTD